MGDIKLTYEASCKCCKYEKTLYYLKNGQIIKVKPKKQWDECKKKKKADNEKLTCEWLCFKFEQLCK